MGFATTETYVFKLFKRIGNSAYEYEKIPSAIFYGRPANTIEKKTYRIIKGVNGQNESSLVYCSNLPKNVNDGDKVEFMGKIWTITSIGFYMTDNRIVNASIFSPEYLMSQCPKGLSLE